jgi:hypothetical protein
VGILKKERKIGKRRKVDEKIRKKKENIRETKEEFILPDEFHFKKINRFRFVV